MTLTLKQINSQLQKRGIQEELVKGKGYFYFYGGNSSHWRSTSIYVNSLSQLTMEMVLEEHAELSKNTHMSSTFQARLSSLPDLTPTFAEYRTALQAAAYPNLHTAAVPTELLTRIKSWFGELKGLVKVGASELVAAFSTARVFRFLKTIRFNLTALLKGLKEVLGLLHKGLGKVFQELADSGVVKQLRSGALKLDALIKKHPLLSRVTGVVVAGILFYMWLNMSFTGNFESDFDVSLIAKAMAGSYSLESFFTGSGLLDSFLFVVGSATGLSFPWLASSLGCVLVAILYTGFVYLKDKPQIVDLRKKIHFGNPGAL